MSRRRSPRPLPEAVVPVPPGRQQHGSLRRARRLWDNREMSRWWRQRDNAAKRDSEKGRADD